MKAAELRERGTEELIQLEGIVRQEFFANRMKNFTNRLDDTSVLRSKRRDIARIKGILRERELAAAKAASGVAGDES